LHEAKDYQAIMLSSSFTDLLAHRQRAIEAISELGYVPRIMEHTGADADADLIESSLNMVRDSAGYVGVISLKYGQTPVDPVRNPDRLSITELEFKEALRLHRPIVLLIMGDDHPVKKADIEADPEKRKKLNAFREGAKRMFRDRGGNESDETFESLKQFSSALAIDLAKLVRTLERSLAWREAGGPRMRSFALSNLSSMAPQTYVGREAEIESIHENLMRADRSVPVLIYGPPGSGKASLAAAYADRHRDEYRATWIIRAHNSEAMRQDIVELGARFGWTISELEKRETALRTVMERLRTDGNGILLIYNDATNQSELSRYLPSESDARIIVTTADPNLYIAPVVFEIAVTHDEHVLKKGSAADYFLSYSTTDEPVARNVAAVLEGAGYSVFAQYKDIPIGSNFVEEMKRGLGSGRVVALLSPAYESSQHCQAEWNAAYANDPDGSKRKLIPLLIEPTELNFLARQVVYANLVGLSGKAFEQRILHAVRGSTPATAPIENIVSPVRHEWTADAKLAVQHGALPRLGFGRGPGDLLKQLSTARKLAKRLADQSASPQFNHSKQYASQFTAYLDDLPTSENDGNIYLADAAARTLREMFAAEADILSLPFAAPLKTFLECHVGMRAYYPELSEFYASVRDGVLVTPLSLDAVERVRTVIDNYTPDQFDPSVGRELAKEEASAPPIATEREEPVASSSTPQPPPDPIGSVDRAQSRDQLVARSLNGLWSTFLRGKDIVPNIEGWRRAYESLEPTIRPVLDYLRQSLGG
jgi:hypothetical protein